MAIFQGSRWASTRSRLRAFTQTLIGAPPTAEAQAGQLSALVQLRGELAAGHGDLLRMLAPSALADTLGDPERIAAYAESLAAEAVIRETAGETARAEALRARALEVAREAQRRLPAADAEIEQLIARHGRIVTSGGTSESRGAH
jgi:hypothetical protein